MEDVTALAAPVASAASHIARSADLSSLAGAAFEHRIASQRLR